MNQLLNGHPERKPDPLAGLAARLTEAQDRETYAAVLSYVRSLPPSDEFRRLVELLGLLSLLGQRIPDALTEFMKELRAQTKAAGEYHGKLDARLASLPQEFSAGVDSAAIARAMSEAFRQQIAASGLQDTAALLKTSVGEVQALSGQLAAALKPVNLQYKTIGATLSTDLASLTKASADLRDHNSTLVSRSRNDSWGLMICVVTVFFLVGGLFGIWFEKGQTLDLLSDMNRQIQRIHTPTGQQTISKVPAKKSK